MALSKPMCLHLTNIGDGTAPENDASTSRQQSSLQLEKVIHFIPEDGATFQIDNFNYLVTSRRDRFVCTYCFYTRPRQIPVRVRFFFEKHKESATLRIDLLVSRGYLHAESNDLAWPIRYEGIGHVLNRASGEFVELWRINGELSEKPSKNEENVIPTEITFGDSSRSSLSVRDLYEGSFVHENSVFMKWFVRAL